MSMEAPIAQPADAQPAPPTPRRRGRPIKWFAPTDGSPMPDDVKEALRKRELGRRLYVKNADDILRRAHINYMARVARRKELEREVEAQRETLRQFEELKKAIAMLLPPVEVATQ